MLDSEPDGEQVPREGARVLPCFPCDFLVFIPGTKPTTCIREQRYRAMYNDILVSGARRFVVPFVQKEAGGARLAEVAVVFHLEDLQEVSEETDDRLKYICSHSVPGRVRLLRVLNPHAFADASTYLRAEVEDVKDVDPVISAETLQDEVREAICRIGTLRASLDLRIRFSKADLDKLDLSCGTGFWSALEFWRTYIDRLDAQKLEWLLYQTPVNDSDEFRALRARLEAEAKPGSVAYNKRLLELLQSESHSERLELFLELIHEEERRLRAQLALKSAFSE